MIGSHKDVAEIYVASLHHGFLLYSSEIVVGLLLLWCGNGLHVVLKLIDACEEVRTLLHRHLPLCRTKREQVLQLLRRIDIILTSCHSVAIQRGTIQV